MMRRGPLLLFASLALLVVGCSGFGLIRGSGRLTQQEVLLSQFSEVELQSSGTLHIEPGQDDVLRIEAEDNIIRHIEAQVRGDKLQIDTETGFILRPRKPINYYLTARSLQAITVSGSGAVQVSDLNSQDFQIIVRGSGTLTIGTLNTNRLHVTISDSGRAEVGQVRAGMLDLVLSSSGSLKIEAGSVISQVVTISGVGSYEAAGMSSQTADVDILGSGTATIDVREHLDISIGGSGALRYRGSPTVERNIAGSGKIERIGN